MAFITDDQLKQSFSDVLKLNNVTDLKSFIKDQMVSECNLDAYHDIRGALFQRGYSAAQIDSWDRGAVFNRDIGIFWLLCRVANVNGWDFDFTKEFDRRLELATVAVTSGDLVLIPAGSPSGASFSQLNTTNDRWTLDTPL